MRVVAGTELYAMPDLVTRLRAKESLTLGGSSLQGARTYRIKEHANLRCSDQKCDGSELRFQ